MPDTPTLAIIGGSGLYSMSELTDIEVLDLSTPFGKPSSPIVSGKISGKRVVFLARHGTGHMISPSEINYRANIYALKSLGVRRIVSISACGSLREDYAPGHIVVPDQLFDFTKNRKRTFFEEGLVGHVGVADPFCPDLSLNVFRAVQATGATVHQGGALITIEGPRFSTRGESNTFRSWGMSIIGMTTSPEAFLAREAEICYGVMAPVTDYDVWHISEEPVSVEMVIRVMKNNTETPQKAIRKLVENLSSDEYNCSCGDALASALITARDQIPEETKDRLHLLVKKYLEN